MRVQDIQRQVATAYDTTVEEMLGPSRCGPAMRARRAAMYLSRVLTRQPWTHLGRMFNRDHKTIMSSVENTEQSGKFDEILGKFSYMGG